MKFYWIQIIYYMLYFYERTLRTVHAQYVAFLSHQLQVEVPPWTIMDTTPSFGEAAQHNEHYHQNL